MIQRVPVSRIVRESWEIKDWKSCVYLPVFPNTIPYNELLLRNCLKIGNRWVYTRTWELSGFRSPMPMLLYNSQGIVRLVTRHYADTFNAKALPRGRIVGYAELADVRPLRREEIIFIFGRFNGMAEKKALRAMQKYFRDLDNGKPESSLPPYIWPCEVGLFFSTMIRFENPVRYVWQGRKRLAFTPLKSVAAELRKVGVDPQRVSRLMSKTIPR